MPAGDISMSAPGAAAPVGDTADSTERPSGRQKRKLLTHTEKLQLESWGHKVERSFQMHRRAANMYEKWNFWFNVLPTLFFSAASALIALLGPAEEPSNSITRGTVAGLNAINGIVIGIATYWKWPAKAEKNSYASNEYNALLERIMLLKNKIEMGQTTFANVLAELETKTNEIRKQCGAPPLQVEKKYDDESLFNDFQKVSRIQNRREEHLYESQGIPRCCFRLLPRCCLWLLARCCCRRRSHGPGVGGKNPRAVAPLKGAKGRADLAAGGGQLERGEQLLDVQISRVGNNDAGIADFKRSFWVQVGTLVQKADRPACESMLKVVPPISQVQMVECEPNRRNLLHLVTSEGFDDLGWYLFERAEKSKQSACIVALQLLMVDCDGYLPLLYSLQTSNAHWDANSFVYEIIVKTFEAWCFAQSGESMREVVADSGEPEWVRFMGDMFKEAGVSENVRGSLRDAILQAVENRLELANHDLNKIRKRHQKSSGNENAFDTLEDLNPDERQCAKKALEDISDFEWLGRCPSSANMKGTSLPTGAVQPNAEGLGRSRQRLLSATGGATIAVDVAEQASTVSRASRRPLLHIAAEHGAVEAVQLLVEIGFPLSALDQPAKGEAQYALQCAALARGSPKVFCLLAQALVDRLQKLSRDGSISAAAATAAERRELCRNLRRGWYELGKKIKPSLGRVSQEDALASVDRDGPLFVRQMFQEKSNDGKTLLHDLCRCPCSDEFLREHELDDLLPVLLYSGEHGAPVVDQQKDLANQGPFEYELTRGVTLPFSASTEQEDLEAGRVIATRSAKPNVQRMPRMRVCKYLIVNRIHMRQEREALDDWRHLAHAMDEVQTEPGSLLDKEQKKEKESRLPIYRFNLVSSLGILRSKSRANGCSAETLLLQLSILAHTSSRDPHTAFYHAANHGCASLVAEFCKALRELVLLRTKRQTPGEAPLSNSVFRLPKAKSGFSKKTPSPSPDALEDKAITGGMPGTSPAGDHGELREVLLFCYMGAGKRGGSTQGIETPLQAAMQRVSEDVLRQGETALSLHSSRMDKESGSLAGAFSERKLIFESLLYLDLMVMAGLGQDRIDGRIETCMDALGLLFEEDASQNDWTGAHMRWMDFRIQIYGLDLRPSGTTHLWSSGTTWEEAEGEDEEGQDSAMTLLHLACRVGSTKDVAFFASDRQSMHRVLMSQSRDPMRPFATPLQIALINGHVAAARMVVQEIITLPQTTRAEEVQQDCWRHLAEYLRSGASYESDEGDSKASLMHPYHHAKMKIWKGSLLHFTVKFGYGSLQLTEQLLQSVGSKHIFRPDTSGTYPNDKKMDDSMKPLLIVPELQSYLADLEDSKGERELRVRLKVDGTNEEALESCFKKNFSQKGDGLTYMQAHVVDKYFILKDRAQIGVDLVVIGSGLTASLQSKGAEGKNGKDWEQAHAAQKEEVKKLLRVQKPIPLVGPEWMDFHNHPVETKIIAHIQESVEDEIVPRADFFVHQRLPSDKNRSLWHYACLAAFPRLLKLLLKYDHEGSGENTTKWSLLIWDFPRDFDSIGTSPMQCGPWTARKKHSKAMKSLLKAYKLREMVRQVHAVQAIKQIYDDTYQHLLRHEISFTVHEAVDAKEGKEGIGPLAEAVVEKMSVKNAKLKCADLAGCLGFSIEGKHRDGIVPVIFHQGLDEDSEEAGSILVGWTRYLVSRDGARAAEFFNSLSTPPPSSLGVQTCVCLSDEPDSAKQLRCLPVRSYGELLSIAKRARPMLKDFIDNFMATSGVAQMGIQSKIAGIKEHSRTKEKVTQEYNGDFSRVLDMVRMTFICPSLASMVELYQTLTEKLSTTNEEDSDKPALVRVKSRIGHGIPETGYRDMLLNVEFSMMVMETGEESAAIEIRHVVEIQFHHVELLDLKKTSHKEFEIMRIFQQLAPKKQEPMWELIGKPEHQKRMLTEGVHEIRLQTTELLVSVHKADGRGVELLSGEEELQVRCCYGEISLAMELETSFASKGQRSSGVEWNYGPELVNFKSRGDLTFYVEKRCAKTQSDLTTVGSAALGQEDYLGGFDGELSFKTSQDETITVKIKVEPIMGVPVAFVNKKFGELKALRPDTAPLALEDCDEMV